MAVAAADFIEAWVKKDAELIKQGLPIETVNGVSETIFRSVAESLAKQPALDPKPPSWRSKIAYS
jgi:hypothetical protein